MNETNKFTQEQLENLFNRIKRINYYKLPKDDKHYFHITRSSEYANLQLGSMVHVEDFLYGPGYNFVSIDEFIIKKVKSYKYNWYSLLGPLRIFVRNKVCKYKATYPKYITCEEIEEILDIAEEKKKKEKQEKELKAIGIKNEVMEEIRL